jgi:hypothetical protein
VRVPGAGSLVEAQLGRRSLLLWQQLLWPGSIRKAMVAAVCCCLLVLLQ